MVTKTGAGTRTRRGKAPSPAEQHAEWLALLRPDGPFIGLPVLTGVFPNGVEALPQPVRERVRQAWSEFDADPHGLRTPWVDLVLEELLRYPPSVLRDAGMAGVEFAGAVRPDQVVIGPDPSAPGGKSNRLLVFRREVEPEAVARVCRDTRTPLALVTDGRLWTLVHARPGGPTSSAVFDADLWQEEPLLLRAFVTLLSAQRALLPPDREDSLSALFTRTENEQSAVTDTLGGQVRQAVELLVGEFARLDREAGGALLAPVAERDIYRAALTTLMRLVFLLYAEQRELLPVKDPVYRDGYAVTALYEQLNEDRDRYGEEIGDRRCAAWFRLLATFAAIHGGCEHPDLRIPPHGGSLFDPKAHPWLASMHVTDRVVHEILDALLILKHRAKAAERLSYTGLDVEQIGHVYEGLLEFSCKKVDEPYVGLIGKLEPELSLAELERGGVDFKAVCDLTPKQLEKALAAQPGLEDVADLHTACDNDAELAERVRPFWGMLRKDLRGEPTVFPAGSVLFTQVGDRRATGTHYTPKKLAREVVEHTLAPLCYIRDSAGSHRLRTAEELLELKVCDPTMGSGAFLVSACDFLAEQVVRAWERDGYPEDVVGTTEEIRLIALRKVAAKCIYGVDRDDMAVELTKLSLWILTLARNRPFGFLDHVLRCGDSLIGLVDEKQVERFHIDPDNAPEQGWTFGFPSELIGPTLDRVAELHREIEKISDDDTPQIQEKKKKLDQANKLVRRLRRVADAVVAAALSTAGQGAERYQDRLAGPAEDAVELLKQKDDDTPLERQLVALVNGWLSGTRAEPIRPFHWALEFPEIMRRGGFDAVVGNPPFIGGKRVSGALGTDVREYLKQRISGNKPGHADLCSYFLLRDLQIADIGRVGIIATNTIAQGDTREVGLDQVVDRGWKIYRAVKSQPWPGTASLEVSLLWISRTGDGEVSWLDGREVKGITPSLDPQSRMSGNPYRLVMNDGQSFIGSYVLGSGFVLSPEHARELIRADGRNRDVLFPYINGEDLNSRPDCTASRWVINFHDWSVERAQEYPEVFSIVDRDVRPERQRMKPDGSYALRKPLPQRWWQYADKRPALSKAIVGLKRVLAITLVSKIGLPAWVSTGQVFSHALGIFAVERDAYLTLLTSNVHFVWWTTKGESTLETRLRYTPSDGFETFPQPELTERMDRAGEELHSTRRRVMLDRQLGLTKLYNLVHDETVDDLEIRRLREIHTEVDYAVAEAYGWNLDLKHGFQDTRQGRRFTVDPVVQVDVLDNLLELNYERYRQEVAHGLHSKGKKIKRKAPPVGPPSSIEGELFPPEGALF
ncbi:Eco57I restriction-modification methylase domain-containing protein [Actinosynnema sp. NPDC059335]|uniref:Eco57I restriction-modification methylase domain-containing protein n=1 Tax=Actinosynnema sp. NPDC059335 TaxID=3346804 RepID=UPI00366E416E